MQEYQREASAKICRAFSTFDSVLLQQPPAPCKTVIATDVIKSMVTFKPEMRIGVMGPHRESVCEFQDAIALENDLRDNVFVQAVSTARERMFFHNTPVDLLVIDECEDIESYQKVLEINKDPMLLGFTSLVNTQNLLSTHGGPFEKLIPGPKKQSEREIIILGDELFYANDPQLNDILSVYY